MADINRNGTILQKLRGHDEEIHCLCWSPIPGEDLCVNDSESSGINFNVSSVEFIFLKNNRSYHVHMHIFYIFRCVDHGVRIFYCNERFFVLIFTES